MTNRTTKSIALVLISSALVFGGWGIPACFTNRQWLSSDGTTSTTQYNGNSGNNPNPAARNTGSSWPSFFYFGGWTTNHYENGPPSNTSNSGHSGGGSYSGSSSSGGSSSGGHSSSGSVGRGGFGGSGAVSGAGG